MRLENITPGRVSVAGIPRSKYITKIEGGFWDGGGKGGDNSGRREGMLGKRIRFGFRRCKTEIAEL